MANASKELQRKYQVSWNAQADERQTRLSDLLYSMAYHNSQADRNDLLPTIGDVQPILNVHANSVSDLEALEQEMQDYHAPISSGMSITSTLHASSSRASSSVLHSSPPSLSGKRFSDDENSRSSKRRKTVVSL